MTCEHAAQQTRTMVRLPNGKSSDVGTFERIAPKIVVNEQNGFGADRLVA